MRFLVGSILALIAVVFVQSAPVVRQTGGSLGELQGLDGDLDEFLAEMADLLPPDQYQAFEQEFFELLMSFVAAGEVDPIAVQLQFQLLLEKYLGSDLESRSDLFQGQSNHKIVKTVVASIPHVIANVRKTLGKRQATDNQLPPIDLEAILATMPELSALINPIHEALAQLATMISPAQLKALQDQAVQLILNLAAGNIDVNQFKEQLQALVQQYLDLSGRYEIDIDNLIEQILVTDTAGLPNIIVNILGKHPAN